MDRGKRSRMPRVRRVQQIERFSPTNLSELRDGYVCGWCGSARGRLMLIPHAQSHREVRVFDYPSQAEIVGRVTGVAMSIVGNRSPESKEPFRD